MAQTQQQPQAYESRLTNGDAVVIEVQKGDEASVFGHVLTTPQSGRALVLLTSDYVAVAVVSGTIKTEHTTARGGDLLLFSVEGKGAQKVIFDADTLWATLSAEQQGQLGDDLSHLAKAQKRAKFWGLLEPSGANATALLSPTIEALAGPYLNQPVIVNLRTAAKGDFAVLKALTAQKFAEAYLTKDEAGVAALIDPKPFTDVTSETKSWLAAREAFAHRLIAQSGTYGDQALEVTPDPTSSQVFIINGLMRLTLVDRNRASFVASMELLK